MNTNYQGDGAHLKAVQKDKEKCCFIMPRAPWIKLWYIFLILPLFSLEYGLGMYPQNAIPWLPAYAVLLFLFFYIGVVFFCGHDTYGNRMGVFWAWLNGFIAVNLWLAMVNTNFFWYNTLHYPCVDETGSMYNQKYVECLVGNGMMENVGMLIFFIIDMWGAYELYRWAQWKKEDQSDPTAICAKNKRFTSCCVCIPVNFGTCGLFGYLLLIEIIVMILFMGTYDGAMAPPIFLCIIGPLVFYIALQWFLCSAKKFTKQGRMILFYFWVGAICVFSHLMWLVVIFIESYEWNYIHIVCANEAEAHDASMEECYM